MFVRASAETGCASVPAKRNVSTANPPPGDSVHTHNCMLPVPRHVPTSYDPAVRVVCGASTCLFAAALAVTVCQHASHPRWRLCRLRSRYHRLVLGRCNHLLQGECVAQALL